MHIWSVTEGGVKKIDTGGKWHGVGRGNSERGREEGGERGER